MTSVFTNEADTLISYTNKKSFFKKENKKFVDWIFNFFEYVFKRFVADADACDISECDISDMNIYTRRVFKEIIIKSVSKYGVNDENIYYIIAASLSLSLKMCLGYDWLNPLNLIGKIVFFVNSSIPSRCLKISISKVIDTEYILLPIVLNLKSIKRDKRF